MRRSSKTKVSTAPLAVTSDGSILINMVVTDGPREPRRLVERALAQGSPVFVGVLATHSEVAAIRRWMDDSTVEVVGALWDGDGRRHRRGRRPSR